MKTLRKKLCILMIGLNILVGAFSSVYAETVSYTPEELEYIKQKDPIEVMAFHGGAPIQYVDEKGNIKGIAVDVLELISERSGLVFEIDQYGTLEDALQIKPEIYMGLSTNYHHDAFFLSEPYLKSETSLFINRFSQFDEFQDLRGKRYVRVKGSKISESLQDFDQHAFETRLDTIESVNKNRTDFGVGNDFSIAYYLSSGLYSDVVTVPIKGATRLYSYGFLQNDTMLINIINKTIDSISDTELQGIVLSAITRDTPNHRLAIFFNKYNEVIFLVVFLALFAFIYQTLKLSRAKSKLFLDNQRYALISEFSGELLFEYNLQLNHINFLKKEEYYYNETFHRDETRQHLITILTEELVNKEHVVALENIYQDMFYIRIKQFILRDRHDKVVSIFGSLLDVTDEIKEIEILEYQSRIDGLTNLYNARYTKEKIEKHLMHKDEKTMDAMILIDLDDFKQINDNYGHLMGDDVLRNVAMVINVTFEDAFVIGRYGGDEFSIYLKDVTSCGMVRDLSYRLIHSLQNVSGNLRVTPSIGVSIVTTQKDYGAIFEEADRAMYVGKANGKNNVVIYQENLSCEEGKYEK